MDKDNTPSAASLRDGERGNVFFALFGAVAIVGVLGAGIMATMRGPLSTMVEVNRREQAKAEMRVAANLILAGAGTDECADADSYTEAPPMDTTAAHKPTNGGVIPGTIGSTKTDPWGNLYGYCVWNHGPDPAGQTGCTDTLDGNSSANNIAIAVISSGPDGIFQTSCEDHGAGGGDDYVKPDSGAGDDIVEPMTYNQAIVSTGGLWTAVGATEATIARDLTVTGAGTSSFSGAVDVGGTVKASTSVITDALVPIDPLAQDYIDVTGGIKIGDVSVSGCTVAGDVGMLRINSGALQVCQGALGWQPAGGKWKDGAAGKIYYDTANVGVGSVTDPARALDVGGTFGATGATVLGSTLGVTGAATLQSTLGVTGAGTFNSTLGVVGNFTVNTDKLTVDATNGNTDIAGIVNTDSYYQIDSNTVLRSDTTMADTVLLGNDAGASVTGDKNTILGANAGGTLAGGEGNIVIGAGSSTLDAPDVPAAGTDHYLNIGNVLHGDLANKRLGVGFADDYDVSGFNDTLEVNGNTDITGDLAVSGSAVFGTTVTIEADGDIVASGNMEASDYTWDGKDFTPGTCDAALEKLSWNATTGWECIADTPGGGGSGGAINFTDLGDVPGSYGSGDAGKVVVVNSSEDGLEFVTAGDLDDAGKWEDTLVGETDDIRRNKADGDVLIGAASSAAAGVDANASSDLYVEGLIRSNARFYAPNGAAATPSYVFAVSPTTGIYSGGADVISFANAGVATAHILANGDVGIGTATVATGVGGSGQNLLMEVNGPLGATYYCDVDGEDCFTPADVAANTGTPAGNDREIQFNDNGDFGASSAFKFMADGDLLLTGTHTGTASVPVAGAGARLFFDSQMSAFRAGEASGTQWNNANIGPYSVAFGNSTIALGDSSFAAGWTSEANGGGSVAMGSATTAGGFASVALGQDTTASGLVSTAMGFTTTASGDYSTALGSTNTASGLRSTTIGYLIGAAGDDSIVFGREMDISATGDSSVGFGLTTTAAVGVDPIISGARSFGVFMGDHSDVTFAATNTMGLFGGKMVIDPTIPATQLTARGVLDLGAATDALILPSGTDAQRPGTPAGGMIRYNTDATPLDAVEYYDAESAAWIQIPTTAASSSVALSSITAATAANTIGSADYAQAWNWTLTTAAKSAMTFGETVAATNGAGAQSIVKVATLGSSTAMPLWIENAGNELSFRVDDEDSDATPFVIDADGYVGIGTDAPETVVHIKNPVVGNSTLTIGSPDVEGSDSNDAVIKLYGEHSGIVSSGTITQGSTNMFLETPFAVIVDAHLQVSSGKHFRLEDASNTKYGQIIHDGNDLAITSSSGDIVFPSNKIGIGTDAPAVSLHIVGTDAIVLPSGTDAQRPGTPAGGMIRYNTTATPKDVVEYYDAESAAWIQIPTTAPSSSVALSSITAATATNTIDSLNFAQTWDWSTLATETAMAMNANAITSGKMLNLASSSTAFTGTMAGVTLSGSNAANTGTLIKSTVSGASSAAVPVMVTNAGTGLSLRVNDDGTDSDSTPVVVDASGKVAIGAATARALLDVNGDDFIVSGTYSGTASVPVTGAGTRLFFDTQKAALRAGYVSGTQWDNASIGNYSTAMGFNATASGLVSVALGETTTASNDNSVALGRSTTASGQYSTAMGISTTASGNSSTAMGNTTFATGQYSTAMGYITEASGLASVAGGYTTAATGALSTAFGRSVVAGNGTAASGQGDGSMAIGLIDDAVTISTRSQVTGIQSLGIFMGDQDGLVVSAANQMSLLGGKLVIDPAVPSTNLSADTALEVTGTIKIGDGGEACAAGTAGGIRYNGGVVQWCNGTAWANIGSAGSSTLDDLTDAETDYATDFNMFLGSNAGAAIAAGGQHNIALGQNAGDTISTGDRNIAIGYDVLTTGATMTDNVGIGFNALKLNQSGGLYNVAVGSYSLDANTTGDYNLAVGFDSLGANQGGGYNIAIGHQALLSNVSGGDNIAIGPWALDASTGDRNVAIGGDALTLTTGHDNTALGYHAGNTVTTGNSNILIGSGITTPTATTSSYLNIGGVIKGDMTTGNIALIGTAALAFPSGTTAQQPASPVNGMMRYNSTLGKFEGYQAGVWTDLVTSTASLNFKDLNDAPSSYVGAAGQFVRVVSGETGLEFTDAVIPTVTGQPAPAGFAAAGNTTEIQFNDAGVFGADTALVWNKTSNYLGIGVTPSVALDVSGDIEYTGTIADVSDRRLKKDIKPLRARGQMLDKLSQIETYSFVMKSDPGGRVEFGVMAQEIQKVFPELVLTDMATSEHYMSVNYVGMIAPLIEASKELKAENDDLKIRLSSLEKDVQAIKNRTGGGISQEILFGLAVVVAFTFAGVLILLVAAVRSGNRARKGE